MRIIITILSIVISFSGFAQEPKKKKSSGLMNSLKKMDDLTKASVEANKKNAGYADSLRFARPGYEAVFFAKNQLDESSKYYDHSKTDMPLQGYYIKNDGSKIEAVIAYQKPEFLVGDLASSFSLYLCKSANGKVVDVLNSNLEPNFKAYIKKDQIKAFFVGDQLFANYPGVGWRIVIDEGAIHSFANIFKMENKDGIYYTAWKQTQKLNDEPLGSIMASPSTNVLLDMLEDSPEIIQSYKAGEITLYEAEVTYNIQFESKKPGVVDYILGIDYGAERKAELASANEAIVRQKDVTNAAEEAHRAPRIDPFDGRPTSASAAVASAKPEVAVKKESFKDLLNRIKADGNKVGILVTSKNLVINPGTGSTEGTTKAQVMGSYGPLEGIDKIAKTTAADLNAGFGIDVFEAVDYSQIPVKEGKYGKMDDWWSTKYKVIFIYELEPNYTAIYKVANSETLEREYQAKMHVHGDVIVMSAEEIKPDKLKYVTSSPKRWGSYNSEKFVGPAETEFLTIQQLKAAINPPSDEVVVDAIIESQKEALAKFVKKKSK